MIDLTKIKTYPLSQRKNKVSIKDFLVPQSDPIILNKIADLFPDVLMAKNLKNAASAIVQAREKGKEFALMMGAHLIKCGLSLIIIDLLKKEVITHIALNGAGAIHDFEIACIGETSEDVAEALEDGSFGMAEETASYLNQAYKDGALEGIGAGEAVSKMIEKQNLPHKEYSIFYNAMKAEVPITVHSSIGTDIIHQHPSCSGEALGKTSYADFLKFADTLSKLQGGVIFNLGSSVILPEVFLKALTIVRNLGYAVDKFTAVNMDMLDHYRPRVNVLNRPTQKGGSRFFLQGPVEILLPLLYYEIIAEINNNQYIIQ